MVDNDNDKIKFINELKVLYQQHISTKLVKHINKENTTLLLYDELEELYNNEITSIRKKYIKPFIDKYDFLQGYSSLYVLDKIKHENSHSLYLKYIWENYHCILIDYLKCVGIYDFSFIDCMTKNSYYIKTERSVKNGRIDLCIVDRNEKWVIIVENKISTSVHNAGKTNITQLANYKKQVEKEFEHFERKVFIFLSFTYNRHCSEDWIYSDYYDVFKTILPYHLEDSIVRDYLKTLYYMFIDIKTMIPSNLTNNQKLYNSIISKIYNNE